MHSLKQLAGMVLLLALVPGCSVLLPEVSTMPVVHNPFPQLSRVAVLPFFNLSNEPTVDGVQFAEAYFAELQSLQGFEVVPVGVVEQTIITNGVNISKPEELRRLARLLDVDAVVVGAVTDFSPYYPPRCGMRVEWYSANPGFHEIPAGYGLPWGTPDEEYIPPAVVFDAEMALAREQMKTQTPDCTDTGVPEMMPVIEAAPMNRRGGPSYAPSQRPGVMLNPTAPPSNRDIGRMLKDEPAGDSSEDSPQTESKKYIDSPYGLDIEDDDPQDPLTEPAPATTGTVDPTSWQPRQQATYKVPTEAMPAVDATVTPGATASPDENNLVLALPPDWPDPRGFVPPGPSPVRPECIENDGPVMTHTRIFMGNDPNFTAALEAYYNFRDDARFGGSRGYLERSDDFIRFCCHLHISEMLSARGGAGETRVVERWSDSR